MTFVNESINTDFSTNIPPNYMGIDGRPFVKVKGADDGEDNQEKEYDRIFNY